VANKLSVAIMGKMRILPMPMPQNVAESTSGAALRPDRFGYTAVPIIYQENALPIYEYCCQKCNNKFEFLQRSMANPAKVNCPSCGSNKTDRALSLFAVGAEAAKSSPSPAPGMCGRCGGPGPCGG
jgi:putative FmdB family regulatory protein